MVDVDETTLKVKNMPKARKKVDKLYSTRDLTIEVNSFDEDDCPWEVDEDQRLMLSKSGKQMLGKFTYQKNGTGSKSKNLYDSFAGIFINTEDVVKNGLVFFEVGDEDIVLKAGSKATISPSQCDLSARPKKKSK